MTICKTAIIHNKARLGENISIGSYAIIGDCIIGNNSIIHPHAFIGDGVIIENDVEIFNGVVIGKEPKGAGAIARPIDYTKYIYIGNNSSICPHVIIYYDVSIGQSTLIGDGASIREHCRIGNKCIISRYVTLNYNVKIGDNVKIMDLTHITGNTVIQDNVFISALVGTANDNKIREGYGEHIIGQYIQEGAIVGLGAKILPDIKIGCNAQIGASALVTKDVADGMFVKGIPAR